MHISKNSGDWFKEVIRLKDSKIIISLIIYEEFRVPIHMIDKKFDKISLILYYHLLNMKKIKIVIYLGTK